MFTEIFKNWTLEHTPLVQDYCYKFKIKGALYNFIFECQILVQFLHQFVSHFFSIELGLYASLPSQWQLTIYVLLCYISFLLNWIKIKI